MGILLLKMRVNRDKCSFTTKTAYAWGLCYRWDPSLSMNPVRRFAHFMPPWVVLKHLSFLFSTYAFISRVRFSACADYVDWLCFLSMLWMNLGWFSDVKSDDDDFKDGDNDEDDNDNDSHDIVTGDVTLDRQNILKESQRKSKTSGH